MAVGIWRVVTSRLASAMAGAPEYSFRV